MVDETLSWLRAELEEAYGLTGYVLFGSTVLYLHGLREADTVGDVDVFVSARTYHFFRTARLVLPEGRSWDERSPREGDPPFIASHTEPPVHAFYDWTRRDAWMSVKRCFDEAERVQGWNCIPLELVRHHKRHAESAGERGKHDRDLEVLDYVLS